MVAAFLFVDVDASVIDEAVGGTARVGRPDPGRALGQELVHLGELDIAESIEVDEGDGVEGLLASEAPGVQHQERVGYLRFAFCKTLEALEEAGERLKGLAS